MFELVSALLAQNKFKIEKNGLELLGQKMFMVPTFAFVELQKELKEKKINHVAYDVFKYTSLRWTKNLKDSYHMNSDQVLNWARDTATICGWGTARIVHKDFEKKFASLKLEDSAVASTILKEQGISKHPVDHMFRGLIAGTLSTVLGADVEAVETHCVAQGANECWFVVKLMDSFDKSVELVKNQ